MVTHKNNQGFIAILSLLIVATISMIIAMTILSDGVTNASLSISSLNYENARINANICLEDTLIRIKREAQFAENLDYHMDTDQGCSTTIQWHTPQPLTFGITETPVSLVITGTAKNFTRTFNYDLKIKKFDVRHSNGSINYLNSINIISIEELNG